MGGLPIALGVFLDWARVRELGHGSVEDTLAWLLVWLTSTWLSGFAFGGLLEVIALLGLNHAQPYAALGEPGYKHFVRLRVREAHGKTTVDAFAIGQVDVIGGSPVVLVDSFRWEPRAELRRSRGPVDGVSDPLLVGRGHLAAPPLRGNRRLRDC